MMNVLNEEKKTVLITGSSGYIGTVLQPYLENKGYNCITLDTGFFSDCFLYDPIKDSKLIKSDMRHFDVSLLNDVDAVIHLAGISNDPFGDIMPEKIYNSSRDYSLFLAKQCKKRNVKFIFASSCSIYGKGTETIVNELSALNPQTPYSLNKIQIEEDISLIADYSFNPIFLRFSTLYGMSPRMRFDIVVNMLTAMAFTKKKIMLNSDGQAWRPYVHILDVCKAFQCALEHKENGNEAVVVNVGDSEQNYKIIQIAELISRMVPGCDIQFLNHKRHLSEKEELIRDRKVQDGVDTRTYQVSFNKITDVFNDFKCDWDLDKGITNMLNKFDEINLTVEQFENMNFYRLQKMEYLYNNKQISDDLHWSS